MISADHITFDGDTAWTVVLSEMAFIDYTGADRSCDTCDGMGWRPDRYNANSSLRCHCIDGRHTFEIEVEGCGHDGTGNHICRGARRTYRVSIVPGMVLPIVLARSELPDSTCIVDWENYYCGNPRFAVSPLDTDGYYITLPPAAAPGMFAVQLNVEPKEQP